MLERLCVEDVVDRIVSEEGFRGDLVIASFEVEAIVAAMVDPASLNGPGAALTTLDAKGPEKVFESFACFGKFGLARSFSVVDEFEESRRKVVCPTGALDVSSSVGLQPVG